MKRITIYGLEDPRNGVIRYVGQTEDVYARFLQHLKPARDLEPKDAWIKDLRDLNLMVIMRTLETVDIKAIADEREAYWIHHCHYLAVKQNVSFFNKHFPVNRAMFSLEDVSLEQQVAGMLVTPTDESKVLLAYRELSTRGKVTRTMIRNHLGWNNKQWQTLKAICDKNKILMD